MNKRIKAIVKLASSEINGKHSWLLEYYNKAKSGEIIIGHELKQCLDNLLEDLEDDRFYYDTSDADLRIEFIEGKY